MASAFSHVIVAGALGAAFYRRGVPARFWALGAACAVLPDAVVVALFFRRAPGISRARLWIYFFLATASHGALDALTNGGPGIAFLVPFDNRRDFFPVRPIEVSPLGIRPFFSEWGARVIANEVLWIWLPALVFTAAGVGWRRARSLGRGLG